MKALLAVTLGALAAGCGRVDFGEATRLVEFSARGDHGCGRTEAGIVGCWGRGGEGQLGTGDLPGASVARVVRTDLAADALSTGETTSCLISDGALACWGTNDKLQIAANQGARVSVPVSISLGMPVRSVELGQHGSTAILSDGTLRYWGGNGCGEDGTGTKGNPAGPKPIAGVTGVTDLGISDAFACAVVGSGEIWCWGAFAAASPELDNCSTEPLSTPILSLAPRAPVVDLDGGCHDHVCAVLADGSVWCRGSNFSGQLGDGTNTARAAFVQVLGVDDAVDVGVGAFHTCARRRNGEVVCWGQNDHGQLGRGGFSAAEELAASTVPIGARVDQIEGGCTTTCARTGGQLWCWGSDDSNQLGNGVLGGNSPVPVEAWAGPDAF